LFWVIDMRCAKWCRRRAGRAMVSIALKPTSGAGGRARKRGLLPARDALDDASPRLPKAPRCARRSKNQGFLPCIRNCNSARFQRAVFGRPRR